MTLSTHKNVLVSFYAASAWPVNKYTIQHYYMRKTSVTGSFTDRVTIWPFIKLIRLKVTAARTPTYYVKVHSQILLVRHYFGDPLSQQHLVCCSDIVLYSVSEPTCSQLQHLVPGNT